MEDHLQELIEQEVDYYTYHNKITLSDKQRKYAINSAYQYVADTLPGTIADAISGAQEPDYV